MRTQMDTQTDGETSSMSPVQEPKVGQTQNPSGRCQCGCGGKTTPSPHNQPKYGYKKGDYARYIQGHAQRGKRLKPLRIKKTKSGCWIFLNSISQDGYGRLASPLANLAHRHFYIEKYGPIPDGLELDHLCRVRSCVNPDHLEPVTRETIRNTVFNNVILFLHKNCKTG